MHRPDAPVVVRFTVETLTAERTSRARRIAVLVLIAFALICAPSPARWFVTHELDGTQASSAASTTATFAHVGDDARVRRLLNTAATPRVTV